MRVLFVTPTPHLPQGTGGIEVNTDALCKALIRSGVDARILCSLRRKGGFFGTTQGALWKLRGNRKLIEDSRRGYPVYRVWNFASAVEESAASIKPDVVVVQGWPAYRLAKPFVKARIPTIIYIHTVAPFTVEDEMRETRCLYCIVNSRFTETLHHDKQILRIVPPLIERDQFRVASTRESVVFVNPVPKKGLDIAVDLARHRPHVPFDFFESWQLTGQEKAHARLLTKTLPNITWHSAVPDMRRAYRRARLVLIPSVTETWGRVASEGHISGIPTLGSRRGALPDTIGPGGICVTFDGPREAWHQAFSELWDNAKDYLRFSDAAEQFSLRPEIQPANVVASFTDVLQSVVA